MRTVSVRFSPAEHRLLGGLAAAAGVNVETLIREALTLQPIAARSALRGHLRVVRCAGRDLRATVPRAADPALLRS